MEHPVYTQFYKGLCIYYVIVFGAFESPLPPYVIDCDNLARPPTPLENSIYHQNMAKKILLK